MFDLSELDRWDEALASLTQDAPVQTPAHPRQSLQVAAPTVEVLPGARQTGTCPFDYGRMTHDG